MFQLGLEHLVSQEALHNVVPFTVPMATSCFFLHGEQPAVDNLDIMPLDLSPTSHAAYLWEKAQRLNA